MKKTNLVKFLFGALFSTLFVFTSCSKTDDRDQFVGTYRITVTGSYTTTIGNQTYTEPLSSADDAIITITKSSTTDNTVFVSGFYNAEAEVSGNTISIDPETDTETNTEGLTISMTISHNRGTLSGSTLSFTSNITGNIYYGGASYPIYGDLSNFAYKQ